MASSNIPVLGKRATRVFKAVIQNVTPPDQHAKLDAGQGFMPLVVERLETFDIGTQYSFAHYYEQNGDLMRDPEVVFLDSPLGVIPCSYQQDNLGLYHLNFDVVGRKWSPKAVRDLVSFCNTWMDNIKYQQKVEVKNEA